ncbi:MAG TPA: M64 family metallopeptidase [Chitinophagaceae bacterium]|jgi:hypothetical protein|nr:M64 family metallopeptidase [Chitinophagaceae bacterium]
MKNIYFLLCLATGICISSKAAVHVQTQADGNNYTGVLVSGSTGAKYDIVFIGDGFRLQDQALFNTRVQDALQALQNMIPYSQRTCALNVWRVNVLSTDAGVDHPFNNIFRNTELDCRYGNPTAGEAERCVTSSSPAKCYEAANYAPAYDAVFILVNDAQWGGCAGDLVFSSIAPGFAGIITHELGHKIGSLADEYECYICDGSDDNRTYSMSEPLAANITKQTDRNLVKWKSYISASTPVPTVTDNPPGVVGLFEGGGYYRFAIYRPQMTCHMQTTGSAFCAVCRDEMLRLLLTRCLLRIDINKYKTYKQPFWKIPWCCFCPLFDDFRTRVILPEINIREFNAEVVDSRQNVVAKGSVVNNQLQLEFDEKRGETYFVRLTSASGKYTGQELTFKPQLQRNNQNVRLF